jgi:hypothetical protein
MSADPHPQVERALAPLVTRLGKMDPEDRFHEASSMLEGARLGLTTFAEVRVGAIREMDQMRYSLGQMMEVTGLTRQRINQLLKDR